ncbi:MAG TPA: ABC transporter permease [Bryobacteraceae bacterium]
MTWFETISQDLRFALRTSRRSRGFVVAATVTLALGIGANATIFSIVSGVLLRPLPFAHPERLVQLNQFDPRFGPSPVYYRDLEEERRQGATFEEIVAYGVTSRNLLDVADPERIPTVWAERGLFRMLGVSPLLGRTFREDDPLDVVVLGASLWKRRFGADPSLIGRKITLDHDSYTVIGVMPETFQFPYRDSPSDLWIPWTAATGANRYYRVDSVAARLKPGIAIESARQELTLLSARLAIQYPETNKGRRLLITPLADVIVGPTRSALLTLLGAVALVLFIACANVANLLLARASRRTHEIAVRAALGATRSRLVQQLLTESILLSGLGGLGGLFIAAVATPLVLKFASSAIPRAWEISLDWRVFLFLFAASVATGIAFGLLPALAMSRFSPQTALQRAGGGHSLGSAASGWHGRWLRDGLVVAEIALSFVLLVSAGLLLRAFVSLRNAPAGLVADRVLTLHLTVVLNDYRAPGSYGRYLQELEDRVRTIPGVRNAGFIQYLPLQNWGWTGGFSITGQPPLANGQTPQSELRYVSPGYFDALRILLRSGRLFSRSDTSDAPRVILINEALAHRYFPNEDPVGRKTDRGTIIGVVGDVRTSRLDRPAVPEIYYSFVQNTAATSDAGVSLVIGALTQPEGLVNSVRGAIHQVNPHQVVYNVKTMDRVIADSLSDIHLYLWLIGLFAGLAVLLAASGVYGVIAYVVAARTPEFGLRLALGAGSARILRLVLAYGSRLVACGIVFGAAAAVATSKLLAGLLHGVTGSEPTMLAAVGILLATIGLAACFTPARRAMHVDPNIALKYE